MFVTQWGRNQLLQCYRKLISFISIGTVDGSASTASDLDLNNISNNSKLCQFCLQIKNGCYLFLSCCYRILPKRLQLKLEVYCNNFCGNISKKHRKLIRLSDVAVNDASTPQNEIKLLHKKSILNDEDNSNVLESGKNAASIEMGSLANSDDGNTATPATTKTGAQRRGGGAMKKKNKYKNAIAKDKTERQSLLTVPMKANSLSNSPENERS